VLENRVQRRISGPKREEVTGKEENYITSFTISALYRKMNK
jgi:hypothetical protein